MNEPLCAYDSGSGFQGYGGAGSARVARRIHSARFSLRVDARGIVIYFNLAFNNLHDPLL
jgi:hypothetical protein